MLTEELKIHLQRELPALLRQDQEFREWLEQLIRQTAITQENFDARFERILQEFAQDRADQNRKWDEQRHNWDEQNRKWDEQNRKWDEQNRTNQKLLAAITESRSRYEQGIGALGARWGVASEQSFRQALKGILENSFGVEVLNVKEFDDEGLVFGQPDQVEIDS